jgi:hypothetical protein
VLWIVVFSATVKTCLGDYILCCSLGISYAYLLALVKNFLALFKKRKEKEK